jgi:membrane-associated protein
MADGEASDWRHRYITLPSFRTLLIGTLAVVGLFWIAPLVAGIVGAIDLKDVEHLAAVIFTFVVFDAVIPIFPSESLLTTASNLAAQDGSSIELWRIMLAGSLGAIVGDSLLYWLSRTVLRTSMSARVDQLQQNATVAHSMDVMSATGPTLIVFGRFVPGVRFLLGASMGLTKYPYPRFLLWDSIGGTFWACFTCIFSYLVASVIEDKPLVSIAVSVVVTTALLGLVYRRLKKNWDATKRDGTAPVAATV